jgi:hypothetical protein
MDDMKNISYRELLVPAEIVKWFNVKYVRSAKYVG